MTTHEVLVAARNLLDRQGYDWWNYRKQGCPICPEGAIDTVRGATIGRGELMKPHPAKAAVLACLPTTPYLDLSSAVSHLDVFRDSPMTKAEVLAAFDKAIAATAPAPDVSFVADPTLPQPPVPVESDLVVA